MNKIKTLKHQKSEVYKYIQLQIHNIQESINANDGKDNNTVRPKKLAQIYIK